MHVFASIFLTFLIAHTGVSIWLSTRQARRVTACRNQVPDAFASVVTPEEHAKAADYTVARQSLDRLESVFDALVVVGLTLGGGIAVIANWADGIVAGPVLGGTATVLAVMAVLSLLGLPFAGYRTFRLEQEFGFNRTTPGTFAADLLKGWAIGGVLLGALAAAVLAVMQSTGGLWWLAAWAVWMTVMLLATWAWPRLIAPLFNKFSPLDDASLRGRIDALLARCGFRSSGIFVMDGSRRSSHGNAYFTGLGRQKRIVFFDTLLGRLSPGQIEAVLAHELGHFRLRHVPKRLAAGAAMSLAGFGLLGWLATQDWFYAGLGAGTPSNAKALLLFVLATPAFTWILTPFLAAWSRKHEFEADAFAAANADAGDMAEALVRLYKDNASTLTPDPLYSAYHDSHPAPAERVARLKPPASRPTSVAMAPSA